MEAPKTKKNVSVGRKVIDAVLKLQGSKGVLLPELKQFLQDEKKMSVPLRSAEIDLGIKNAVDRGILSRDGGIYKVI